MIVVKANSRRLFSRTYATSYTARVVRADQDGRSMAVEVDPPYLLRDVRGYALPRRHLICRISQILHSRSATSDPLLDLTDYLQTLSLSLTPSEVSEILKSLKTPDKALPFFHFAAASLPGYQHDCFTYNRILLILANAGGEHLGLVRRMVDEMERAGIRGNISTVNILIGIFEGAQELKRCLQLVKKWGLKFNCYTYKCLLQAYLRSNEVEMAMSVFQEMRRRGYALDIFAYNMLLDSLAKEEKVEQAYKVLREMKRRHCEPDEYTYTILIRMTGKLGKPDEFLSFFDEMISKGCTPNLICYNTMIQALAKNRMVDKMIILFSKMVENNWRPNEFTYSVILNALAAEGQISRIHEVVEVSKKYMIRSVYGYLVRTLGKLGHATEAHKLFCDMWSSQDKGDRDAYMSMLENLCTARKTHEAMDLLYKIHEKGLSTDTAMYNLVFSTLGKSKQISDIFSLYERMKQDGPLPDIFTYNILLSSFGRAGLVDEAFKLLEEMEKNDCKPDVVTYNSLINCLGKSGDIDEAHMRFKEMQERGLSPDVITYSTLIECFGKSNRVEMACRLFDEMLDRGCYPNIVTYNILLDCHEKCDKTADALKLYEKLKDQGLTPDSITYAILERLQSGFRRAIRARKPRTITDSIWHELLVELDGYHFLVLLRVAIGGLIDVARSPWFDLEHLTVDQNSIVFQMGQQYRGLGWFNGWLAVG